MFGNLTDNKVNLDQLPEDGTVPQTTNKAGLDLDLDKFFQTIEQQVNGAIYETEPTATLNDLGTVNLDPVEPTVSDPGPVSEPSNVSAEVAGIRKELDEFKQRYSDSSKEAKRLYEENREMSEYRDYIPILKTMREDPGLINHVRGYLEGNATPPTVKDELGLSEDFIFDPDEAIRNPDSESAKVLNNMIDRGVEQKLKKHTQAENQERSIREQKATETTNLNEFQQKMDMGNDEFNEFIEFAKGRKLTLDDIYFLLHRDDRDKIIAKKAIEEREGQLKKMKNVPASMASTGGYEEQVDPDTQVFEAIAKAAAEKNIFGD